LNRPYGTVTEREPAEMVRFAELLRLCTESILVVECVTEIPAVLI